MARIWHEMHPCAPDDFDMSFKFDNPHEHDYWDTYDLVMDTIIGISIELTKNDEEDIHQVYMKLPIVFEEWEDE